MKKGSDSILRMNRQSHHQHRRSGVKLEFVQFLAVVERCIRKEAGMRHSQQGKQAALGGKEELFLCMKGS